ncbi:hypothetical protein [Hydrogenophaga sp. T2]|uniref:hypothetical protein n=1 Tax=Hydrogenophaga sp. T2 TaxID=3132823 RepID=UPI003CF8DAB6
MNIDVAADHINMQLTEPKRLPWWLGRKHAHTDERADVAARAHRQILNGRSISNALDEAWLDLRGLFPGKPSDVMLDVRLSAAHVFVGLMKLPPGETATTPHHAMQGIAETWAHHVWRLEPGERITRSQKLAPTGAFLVSSTNRSVHEAISSFAKESRLHLRSCLPAALSPQLMQRVFDAPAKYRRQDASAADALILWTELMSTGCRAPQVQLFRWSNGSPSAMWRGWIPPQGTSEADDTALKAAIRRFLRSSDEVLDIAIYRTSWPRAANNVSLESKV